MADGDARATSRGERPSVERDRAAVRALTACYGEHAAIESVAWARTTGEGVHYEVKAFGGRPIDVLVGPDLGAVVAPRNGNRRTYFVCGCGTMLETFGRADAPELRRCDDEIVVLPETPGGPAIACAPCATRQTVPSAPPAELLAS